MDVYEMGLAVQDLEKRFAMLNRRTTWLESRLDAMDAEQLKFPPIDLGLIPGTGPEPKHPFEPFSYTERS